VEDIVQITWLEDQLKSNIYCQPLYHAQYLVQDEPKLICDLTTMSQASASHTGQMLATFRYLINW
jgi:hypothetical protein